MNWKWLSASLLVFLACFIGFEAPRIFAIPAPSRNSIVEPGSMSLSCSYVNYVDGITFIGKNAKTGANDYQATTESSIMTSEIAALTTFGGRLCFQAGNYTIDSTVLINVDNIFISCEGNGQTQNVSGASRIPFTTVLFKPTANIATDGDMFKVSNSVNTIQGFAVTNCGFHALTPAGNPVVVFHIQDVDLMWATGNTFGQSTGANPYDPAFFVDGAGLSGALQTAGAGAFWISNNNFGIPVMIHDNNMLDADLFIVNNWIEFSRGSMYLNFESGVNTVIINGNKCEQLSGMSVRVGTSQGNRPGYCVDLVAGSVSANNVIAQITNNIMEGCPVFPCMNIAVPGVVVRGNFGYNPFGLISKPFGASSIGFPNGTATNPTASTTYTVWGVDIANFTSSAGTGVVLTIKDRQGNCLVCGAATITNMHLDIQDTVNFGAFSVAPTVKVYGQ